MTLKFLISKTYLIAHVLAAKDDSKFSSRRHMRDIVLFQNFAWKRSRICYNLFAGRVSPRELTNRRFILLAKRLPNFFAELSRSKYFWTLHAQVKEYLKFCQEQWDTNYTTTSKIIRELTGFSLDKKISCYVTHPSLKSGQYLGNNAITWGHEEDWPNYTNVFLWHEILHSYFTMNELNHALIQLIADQELRVRLNGGKYPPFVGHHELFPLMNKILPHWKKYLASKRGNISTLRSKLIKNKEVIRTRFHSSLDGSPTATK